MIGPLESPDSFHLSAAEGWLELGNQQEALAELGNIAPKYRKHPLVLCARWQLYAKSNQWEKAIEVAQAIATLAPNAAIGWIHWAYSLHELKRTREARAVLLPVVSLFPEEYTLRYNLACYECQLGDLPAAWDWLQKAIAMGNRTEVQQMALNDPDLQPLKDKISGFDPAPRPEPDAPPELGVSRH
jgi:Flp pilus assembly protein TadD